MEVQQYIWTMDIDEKQHEQQNCFKPFKTIPDYHIKQYDFKLYKSNKHIIMDEWTSTRANNFDKISSV